MEEAISFFRAYEPWIYVILGLGGLFYLRKFILAWRELHVAAFGLERENAQARLNSSAIMLVLILIIAVFEFILVYFIGPSISAATPLPSPTLSILTTNTTTLVPATTQTSVGEISTPIFTEDAGQSGCIPGQIVVSSPKDGEIVRGVVEIIGTANIENFGFYKLGMKRPDESLWATIQAGNQIKINEKLGDWDTRQLVPGVYQMSLVVVDNEAKASQPCAVQVNVTTPLEESPSP